MKYHLMFKNYHKKVLRATEEFFKSGPWTGSQEDKHRKFTKWITKSCEAYGLRVPTLEIRSFTRHRMGSYGVYRGHPVISLNKYSVVTLFHEFRHHMQHNGLAEDVDLNNPDEVEEDAMKWSASLYYRVRPYSFRKAVREGKITFMHPRDLLRNPDEYVEPQEVEPGDVELSDVERQAFEEIVAQFEEGE